MRPPGWSGLMTSAYVAYAEELNHANTESPATSRSGPIGFPGRRSVTKAPTVGSGTYARYTAAMSQRGESSPAIPGEPSARRTSDVTPSATVASHAATAKTTRGRGELMAVLEARPTRAPAARCGAPHR